MEISFQGQEQIRTAHLHPSNYISGTVQLNSAFPNVYLSVYEIGNVMLVGFQSMEYRK
jgi:hypothetical protein